MKKTKKLLLTMLSLATLAAGALSMSSCDLFDIGANSSSNKQSSDAESGINSGESHKHTYKETVTLPTCTEKGYTTYFCECGENYIDKEVDALGHNYVENICEYCQDAKPSKGLVYVLSEDGTSYGVSGIGTCMDKKIVIPSVYDGKPVTSVMAFAFGRSEIKEKRSVMIPDSITSIGNFAFGHVNISEIIVSENNKVYKSVDGNLYNKDGSKLLQYAIGKTENSFTVPDGVTSIGLSAFFSSQLINIKLSNTVTSIEESAFGACGVLTSIKLSNNLASIASYTFSNCWSLTGIEIPESVISIGNDVFNKCRALANVYYRGTVEKWAKISIDQSNNDLNLAKVHYYSEQEPVEDGDYWHYDEGGEIVVWPKTEGLAYALSEDGTSYVVKGLGTYTDKKLVIPLTYKGKPVTAIADWAFYNDDLFTEAVISENITTIGEMAFAGCEGLTEISIPKNVNSIEYGAFAYCSNISSVTISEGVKSLGMMVFSSCNLTSVTIPASVESIGEAPFNACQKLTEIIVSENNAAFKSMDGVLYSKDGTKLIKYPMAKTDATFQIPDSVTEIGGYAFYYCTNLTDIDIPDSVRTIGRYALYGCEKLSSIELPDGVTAIEEYTFSESDNLKSVIIGKEVTSIANGVFSYCKNLKVVYFKGSEEEWSKISIGTNNKSLTSATVYYYSENEPEREGNYWHYADGVPTAW